MFRICCFVKKIKNNICLSFFLMFKVISALKEKQNQKNTPEDPLHVDDVPKVIFISLRMGDD